METKKRPNEDTLESRVESSAGHASETSLAPMDIEMTKADSPQTVVTESNKAISAGDSNKRYKPTKESEKSGTDYSSVSTDLADPSTETKALADWVEKMDEDDKAKGGMTEASLVDKASTMNEDKLPGFNSTKVDPSSKEIDKDSMSSKPKAIADESSDRTLENIGKESVVGLSDSILAVGSLSEPLVSTLETLENEEQASINNTKQSPVQEADDTNTHPQSPSTTVDTKMDTDTRISEPMNHNFTNQAVDDTVECEGTASKKEQSHPYPDTAGQHQNINNDDNSNNNINGNLQQSEPDRSASVKISDIFVKEGSTIEASQAASAIESVNGALEKNSDGLWHSSREADTMAVQAKPLSESKETRPEPEEKESSYPINRPTQQPTLSSASHPPGTQAASSNPDVRGNSLPPISSLSASQDVPASSQPLQTTTRPSRSSMSVSALLLNNDDVQEQEQDHGRRNSKNIFDPFGASDSASKASSPSPVPVKPLHPTSSQTMTSSQPLSQLSKAPLTPHQSSPTSPRLSSSAAASARAQDSMEVAPIHQSSSEYGRDNLPSGRNYDSALQPHPTSKGLTNRDYASDEIVESGGMGGYANQRHRLSSPVGVRPLQEPVSGSATTGSGHQNNKLPGLGSIASVTPAHAHDPHFHSGGYRNDNSHVSISSSRTRSFSPNQHTHSSGANGPAHYSGTTGHISYSGLSQTSPSSAMLVGAGSANHHPRLIVKNDPNLKMEGRPEQFLGYFRYDPAQLLPSMQGKENSMLEVRVASSYLTYNNAKIKKREVWGTDVYTDDSDVVAMLIHSGFYIPPLNANSTEQDLLHPTSQQHNFVPEPIKHICPGFDLAVTLRVLPKLVKYQGSIRHRIKSRTWNTGHDGVSFKIESIRKLCPGEALNRGRGQSKLRMKEYNQERLRVLANIHDETTESLQNERAMRTATFEFTNQGDPCFKYSPELVMDRHDGLSRKWTSWRLKKEVMILENDEERYEISLQHHAGTDARRFDQYRFAVISPRTSLSSWSKTAYPLDPADLTEVLYEDLDWQDFEWVERGVVVQPSQRAKQNSSSSSMEGVEPTTEGQSKTFLPTTEVMDIDGGESKGNGQEDGSRKLKSGPSNPSDTLDTQQDGVFCVVSRLFWRPMSELRPAKSVKVGQSKSTEIKPANGLEKINATEMHHPQVEVKETAPTLTKSSGNSYEQIGVPSSSSASPKTSSAQDDNNSKAQTSFGTLRTKDPSQDHVVTTVSISDQPSSASIGAASAVPATTARSVQEAVRPQEPSGQHEPQHLQAKPPHSDSVAAEREEGELEESE